MPTDFFIFDDVTIPLPTRLGLLRGGTLDHAYSGDAIAIDVRRYYKLPHGVHIHLLSLVLWFLCFSRMSSHPQHLQCTCSLWSRRLNSRCTSTAALSKPRKEIIPKLSPHCMYFIFDWLKLTAV